MPPPLQPSCSPALPLLLLAMTAACLLLALPARAQDAAAGGATAANTTAVDSGCAFRTHFIVSDGALCASQCDAIFSNKGRVGSIYPETYSYRGAFVFALRNLPCKTCAAPALTHTTPPFHTGYTCCKCQYRAVAVAGDPSPNAVGDATAESADDEGAPAASAPPPPSSGGRQGAAQPAGGGKRRKGPVWWKIAIPAIAFAIILSVTAAMLWWDCCKLRSGLKKQASVLVLSLLPASCLPSRPVPLPRCLPAYSTPGSLPPSGRPSGRRWPPSGRATRTSWPSARTRGTACPGRRSSAWRPSVRVRERGRWGHGACRCRLRYANCKFTKG